MLLECDVEGAKECATLRDDIASDLDLGLRRRIAYINRDNIPVVIDPRRADDTTLLPDTVASPDKEDFIWRMRPCARATINEPLRHAG